jgi:sigma-B regulation protein RsbU (phosphoserine phosphatase)
VESSKIRILLVEDNKDFAKLVQVYLQRFQKDLFEITWKENHSDAMKELEGGSGFDIVLMDYFLPGRNGLEITKDIKAKRIEVPIVFLTVNKDFDLALDVMKLGVDDYLVKEEISSPVLPKTVLTIVEKYRLQKQKFELEISQQRLKAIHQILAGVIHDFESPLNEMYIIAEEFKRHPAAEAHKNYIKIIDDNVRRIMAKLEKLKSLKVDKTIKYIKDIKMLDLS